MKVSIATLVPTDSWIHVFFPVGYIMGNYIIVTDFEKIYCSVDGGPHPSGYHLQAGFQLYLQ